MSTDSKIKRVEIYALIDPVSKEIRYIGKANCSASRYKSHVRDCRRRDYPVYRWMKKLFAKGESPILEVLKVTDSENWKKDEIELIEHHKKGGRLLNVAAGGDDPHCPVEVRRENGRNNAKDIHADPLRKQLWYLKKQMVQTLLMFKKQGKTEAYNKILQRAADCSNKEAFAFLSKYQPI